MGLEWLIGVALSVVGNVLASLGTNVLKLGHNKRLQLPFPHPAYKDRSWQAGLVMYGVGNVAMFYAFGYAAQSILAAIGCIQFISNVVFARLVLKEKATRQILTATALVVAGCIVLVVFGNHSSDELSVQQLLDLYENRAYIAYLVIGGATVAASYVLYWLGGRTITAKRSKHIRRWMAAMPVLYSLFSALVCTQSLVFNKAVMVLWRMTLAGDNQFNKWVTWLMALAFLALAFLWVLQLNKGLQRFPALIIAPCMQLCWTLFGVVSGLLYFKEYEGMSELQVAMFVLGVVVVCVGAGMLAHASQHDSAPAAAKGDHRDAEAVAVDVFVAACAAEHPHKNPLQPSTTVAQHRPVQATTHSDRSVAAAGMAQSVSANATEHQQAAARPDPSSTARASGQRDKEEEVCEAAAAPPAEPPPKRRYNMLDALEKVRRKQAEAAEAAKYGPPKSEAEKREEAMRAAYELEFPQDPEYCAACKEADKEFKQQLEAMYPSPPKGPGKSASATGSPTAGLKPPSPASRKAKPGLAHQIMANHQSTVALPRGHRRLSRLRTCSVPGAQDGAQDFPPQPNSS